MPTDPFSEIARLQEALADLLPHRFDRIDRLDDGTAIPPEALSEDHTLGLYGAVVPLKMRENLAGYRAVTIGELRPLSRLTRTPTGAQAAWFLEAPQLRNVRFRSERLQYLLEGWWAVTSEVIYPAETTLALLHAVQTLYGDAHLYLNTELPMPLWIRPTPLEVETAGAQAVIQARGEGRVLSTNIHTECPLEYALRWAQAARGYYRMAE